MQIPRFIATIFILLISILSCGNGNSKEEKSELDKYIKDEALKNCILRRMIMVQGPQGRIPLDISHPFYEEAMEELPCLNSKKDGIIESLEGIERLHWLKSINIPGDKISDISPLEELNELEYIYLSGNRIESIGPLKGLKLNDVDLRFNLIKDASPVRLCLESEDCIVQLHNNCIKDNLGGLIDNTTLSYQDYTRCGDYDLDEPVTIKDENLKKCLPPRDFTRYTAKNISWIDCKESGGNIRNLSGLEYFTHVDFMNLSSGHVKDLSPIKGMESLRNLYIVGNDLESLETLPSETNLFRLFISRNPLKSLRNIESLPNLAYLGASDCELETIDELESLLKLRYLNISGNNIRTLRGLSNCSKLIKILADNGKIESLEGIENCISLESLSLKNNLIKDITPLSNLSKLKSLDLRGNCITDFSPLDSIKDNLEKFGTTEQNSAKCSEE